MLLTSLGLLPLELLPEWGSVDGDMVDYYHRINAGFGANV